MPQIGAATVMTAAIVSSIGTACIRSKGNRSHSVVAHRTGLVENQDDVRRLLVCYGSGYFIAGSVGFQSDGVGVIVICCGSFVNHHAAGTGVAILRKNGGWEKQ